MDLMTTKEVAEMLKMNPATVDRMRAVDPSWLPFVRIGRRTIRYRREDVLRKLDACTVGAAKGDEPQK